MLICIDVSGIDDAAGRGPGAAKSLAAIEHLLRAHHAGKHVVSVPSSAKRALHDRGLSTLAYATLERIIVDRSQIEALRRDLHAHLLTGTGAAFEPTEESPGEHRILRVHLHHFEDFEHASRAVLLGEDRTDAALFDCIGRAWLARMRWRAALAHELRGGGGSSLEDAFDGAARDGRLVLALADSDVTHPGGPTGQTWNKLAKAARGKPGFQRACALPVRTAENLIPLAVYDHALAPHAPDARGTSSFGRLERLREGPAAPAWAEHADLKHGVTLAEVQSLGDSASGHFWREVARCARRDACTRETPCTSAEECGCFVVDGLGKHALERVVAWMKSQPPKRVANLLDLGSSSHAAWVAERVVAWGIAPERRAT